MFYFTQPTLWEGKRFDVPYIVAGDHSYMVMLAWERNLGLLYNPEGHPSSELKDFHEVEKVGSTGYVWTSMSRLDPYHDAQPSGYFVSHQSRDTAMAKLLNWAFQVRQIHLSTGQFQKVVHAATHTDSQVPRSIYSVFEFPWEADEDESLGYRQNRYGKRCVQLVSPEGFLARIHGADRFNGYRISAPPPPADVLRDLILEPLSLA